MSHFAKIDPNTGEVLEKIKAEQDFINSGVVGDSFLWIQTSYNNNFRKRFATIGGTYDKVNDVFLDPKPWPSWSLDSNFEWQPPKKYPDDGKNYLWDEAKQDWFVTPYAVGEEGPLVGIVDADGNPIK
tara:strand:+ start:4228 stop:4611 length:384 start_codon:yes stop_codon:yes gene_type:complete